jgi:hypothetical protein
MIKNSLNSILDFLFKVFLKKSLALMKRPGTKQNFMTFFNSHAMSFSGTGVVQKPVHSPGI